MAAPTLTPPARAFMARRFKPPYPSDQLRAFRDVMGREPGEPLPLGLTLTSGRMRVELCVTDGQVPSSVKLAHLLRPPRRRSPMARLLAQKFVSRAADPAWQRQEYDRVMEAARAEVVPLAPAAAPEPMAEAA